jgi:pyruvate carboxylase
METALHALRDGVISRILVSPGQSVDAKDLLVVLDAVAA